MLLAAVTRNSSFEFLVYCLTGAEEYRITIKLERLREPCVERRMVGARMLDYDDHTYSYRLQHVLSAACSMPRILNHARSVCYPVEQFPTVVLFLICGQDSTISSTRTSVISERLSCTRPSLHHTMSYHGRGPSGRRLGKILSSAESPNRHNCNTTEFQRAQLTSRWYVRLLPPDSPQTHSAALSVWLQKPPCCDIAISSWGLYTAREDQ
jgi:hypothetical protein